MKTSGNILQVWAMVLTWAWVVGDKPYYTNSTHHQHYYPSTSTHPHYPRSTSTHYTPSSIYHNTLNTHNNLESAGSSVRYLLPRRDPLELSGLDEGDILPHPLMPPKKSGAQNKNAVLETIRMWPNGVVPYEFSTEFFLLPLERLMIEQVMREVSRKSCVNFTPRTNQEDYLAITVDRDRCYSHIGRVGGAQVLSLGLMCVTWLDLGPVYHELFHALGFYHEHNRPDRDQYVEIQWDNIADGSSKNFVRREWSDVDLAELPYDIRSVMHYSPFTFGKWYILTPTIKSKKLGYGFWRRTRPSKMDYKKLNRLYRCHREGRWLRSRLGYTGPSALWQLRHLLQQPTTTRRRGRSRSRSK